jgi:putative DNA primase/helicase
MKLDFNALAQRLLVSSETLVPQWLPGGRRRGHEWVCGDLSGGEGASLSVNLLSGRWADFATSDRGGDLVDLYAAIHELTLGEAYRELDDGSTAEPPARPAKPTKPARTVVTPVPEAAADCECIHPSYGAPSARWTYWDGNGEVLGYVARYDPAGQRKQIVPWTWDGDRWGMGQWPVPRPLYRLQELEARSADPVLIVEGEKAADAAAAISGPYVVTTWPGGGQAVSRADWRNVHGRKILLWPDADDAGIATMQRLAAMLAERCPEVKIIDPAGMPDGWDAADSRVHQLAGRTGLDRPAHQRVRAAAGTRAAETDGAGIGGARAGAGRSGRA